MYNSIPSRPIESTLVSLNKPTVNNYVEEIRKVYERVIELRALLTEEMILNFMLTGKNEWQIVEQKFEDRIVIRLEKIEEKVDEN